MCQNVFFYVFSAPEDDDSSEDTDASEDNEDEKTESDTESRSAPHHDTEEETE